MTRTQLGAIPTVLFLLVFLLTCHAAEPPAAIEDLDGRVLRPLTAGTPVIPNSQKHVWLKVDPQLRGAAFFEQIPYNGLARFKVTRSGRVLLACTTRWGGGGNPSGGWQNELTTRNQLIHEGWRATSIELVAGNPTTETRSEFEVFERACKLGETFKLRTEKYGAPIVILPDTPVRPVGRLSVDVAPAASSAPQPVKEPAPLPVAEQERSPTPPTEAVAPAKPALDKYVAPDLEAQFLDVSQLTIAKAAQTRIADLLAGFVRNGLVISEDKDLELAGRMLGLALRLDSTHRAAVIANAQLRRGVFEFAQDRDQDAVDAFCSELTAISKQARAGQSKDDQILATHLFDVILSVNPTHEEALYESELLKAAGRTLDWSWADPHRKPAVHEPVVVDDPRGIVRAAYQSQTKGFEKRQTKLTGLFVAGVETGIEQGFALDIILTILPTRPGMRSGGVRIRHEADPQMQSTLQDAVRAVQLRYPHWESDNIEVSFGEKYAMKEGGSAGAAFALLLLSALEGFDLDPAFAITGDITVDWSLRRVGGVGAKIRGALVDHCKYVGIPAENRQLINDLVLLYGYETIAGIQIFEVSSLHDAVALMRTDREETLTQAMARFAELSGRLGVDGEKKLKNPEVQRELEAIVELAPHHLSARQMLAIANDQQPKHLGAVTSMIEIFKAAGPFCGFLFEDKPVEKQPLPRALVNNVRKRLDDIGKIVDPKVEPLRAALLPFIASCEKYTKNELTDRQFQEQKQNVLVELSNLRMDRTLMERMLREGG